MQEIYLWDGLLIEQEQWSHTISQLRESVRCAKDAPLDELKREWTAAFERAVLAKAKGHPKIGVLFSGGVDSSLIAYVLWKNKIGFTCYTMGFKDPRTKDPEDILEAKRVAQRYGWAHKHAVLDLAELEPVIKRTSQILGDAANPVTVGVGTVVVAAAELANEDGVTLLFGGLGSEEIFAGYHRHDKAHAKGIAAGQSGALDDEAWRGMLKMYERDLIRDCRISAALGITVPTPFLDPAVITLAMRMPESEKIRDGHKKYILRVMAREYGLDEEFAFRPKRAAQYGSRMHKAIFRLAKRAGVGEIEYIDVLASAQGVKSITL